MRAIVGLLVPAVVLGCARPPRGAPVPVLPFAADTTRAEVIRAGVTHWFLYVPTGPWAIHALVIDRDACYSALAVKGTDGAVGRHRTSAILAQLGRSADVAGGVNGDFFLFTPPGVPTNLLVSRGRVVTGPSSHPVLAFDSTGAPHLVTFRVEGSVATREGRYAISAWNRASSSGIALFDDGWGGSTDTLSSSVEVVLDRRDLGGGHVSLIDTMTAGVVIPPRGAVLVGRAPEARAALRSLRLGDSVGVNVALQPFHPLEAVGGRPVLLRDSAVVAEVDTEGGPAFATGRHPRTAVGIGRSGRRLVLVAVDGRQPGYSDGMTLRELATLLRGLGARDAINLDGGGSTTLVYADPDAAGALRIANRPSDAAGERAVGDALAIVGGCS